MGFSGRGEGVKLHLLIDTCVWLDLAKDYRQLPALEAVAALSEAGDLELILPRVVADEFERNKERVVAESKRSLSSHFRLVREAILQFAPEDRRNDTLSQLNEVDHRIAVGGEAPKARETDDVLLQHFKIETHPQTGKHRVVSYTPDPQTMQPIRTSEGDWKAPLGSRAQMSQGDELARRRIARRTEEMGD